MSNSAKITLPKLGTISFGALQTFHGPIRLSAVNNVFHSPMCDGNATKNAQNWFPFDQKNDILIASYPKCGSHFMQKMCLEIINANHDGKYTPDLYKTCDMGINTVPYLEYYVSVIPKEDILQWINATNSIYPRLWFTHHSFDNIPLSNISKQHKIITMIRNPKDTIVSSQSYFNYTAKLFPEHCARDANQQFTIDSMISYFVRGLMLYGCYFKWYETYWNALNNNKYNILWLYYEDCVDYPMENVKKIANFIFDGDDIKNEPFKVLNISDEGYEKIVQNISIDKVRKDVSENPQTFELGSPELFFRKGVNNDWKNHFSDSQSELVDETMYFKWAEHMNDIRYYKELMHKYNPTYNKNYF